MKGREVAELLVDVGAVEIRPDPADWFTWASGKRAPVYCDNRRVLSFVRARTQIADALTESVRERFGDADVIAGTATAGIAWAAWVAERLDRPMIYVRGEAKGHGRKKRVEGRPLEGERVLVLEDLLSFGGSALSAVEGVNAEGGKVVGVQAIVTWGFPDVERRFREAEVPYAALCDYEAILETLTLTEDQARVLREWRES